MMVISILDGMKQFYFNEVMAFPRSSLLRTKWLLYMQGSKKNSFIIVTDLTAFKSHLFHLRCLSCVDVLHSTIYSLPVQNTILKT